MSETNKPSSDSASITERVAHLCPPAGAYYRLLFARGPADSVYYPAQSQKPLSCKRPHTPQYPSAPPGTYLVEFYDDELHVIPPGPHGPPSATISYGGASDALPQSVALSTTARNQPAQNPPAPTAKSSKEKFEDTKNQVAEAKLQMDNELRLEGILSHQALHQHFRSMADSLEDLRQVIMQLGKQDLVEQLKMQRLISEQSRQSLESQLQATDLIHERMKNLEPQKPIADLTVLGSTLLQSITGIWTASLSRGSQKMKGKKGKDKDKGKSPPKTERPTSAQNPTPAAAPSEPMTEQQGDELMKALVESSMQLTQATEDPAVAAQIVARLQGLMGQQASAPTHNAASEKTKSEESAEPDEADEPYVQELPPKEKIAWMMLDRCRLQEKLLVSELKAANRSLLHAKDDEEREQRRIEVENKTLALIACRRDARKYLGKSKLPPNIAAFADAKSSSDSKSASDAKPSPAGSPPSEAAPAADKTTSIPAGETP